MQYKKKAMYPCMYVSVCEGFNDLFFFLLSYIATRSNNNRKKIFSILFRHYHQLAFIMLRNFRLPTIIIIINSKDLCVRFGQETILHSTFIVLKQQSIIIQFQFQHKNDFFVRSQLGDSVK